MQKIWWLLSSFSITFCACTKAKDATSIQAGITADHTLSKLIVISDQLEPEFDPFVNQYTVAGGESFKNKLSINTAPVDPKIKIQVNGVDLRSDFTTDVMPLVAGQNNFVIDLFDTAGSRVNTYKLAVQRVQELPDDEIGGIATSDGTLTPDFAIDTTSYALTVSKDTTVLTVSPFVIYAEETTIVVNGTSYPGGIGSYDVDVAVGTNTVVLEVKGKSGRSKTYTITVMRPVI